MLTGYLDFLLEIIEKKSGAFQVITPKDPDQRGCQLSLLFKDSGRDVFDGLTATWSVRGLEGTECDQGSSNAALQHI